MRTGWLAALGTALALGCAHPPPCTPAAPPAVEPARVSDEEASRYFRETLRYPRAWLSPEQRQFFAGHLLTLGGSGRGMFAGPTSYRLLDPTHVVSESSLLSIHYTVAEAKRVVGGRVVATTRRVSELSWHQIEWCLERWFMDQSPKLELGEATPLLIEGISRHGNYRVATLPYPSIDDPLPERRGIVQCLRLMARAAGSEFREDQCQAR